MGDYQANMGTEKRPPEMIPKGLRLVRITEMIATKSSKGNDMFTSTLEDIATKKRLQFYIMNVPKQRWVLKSLLNALGNAGGQDGNYEWSVSDIVMKQVTAVIDHSKKDDWIDKDCVKHEGRLESVVKEFLPADCADKIEEVKEPVNAWEEEDLAK